LAVIILRLVDICISNSTRPYTAINAIKTLITFLQRGVIDRENREELKTIKAALDRLEGANTFDILAESEDEN